MLTRYDLDQMIFDNKNEEQGKNPVVLFYDTSGNELKVVRAYNEDGYVCIDLEKRKGITPDAG